MAKGLKTMFASTRYLRGVEPIVLFDCHAALYERSISVGIRIGIHSNEILCIDSLFELMITIHETEMK